MIQRLLPGRSARALLALALLVTPAMPSTLEGAIGERLFKRQWVSAPSSTKSNDGLGPLYAAVSCAGCHPRAGAGQTPVVRFGIGDVVRHPIVGRIVEAYEGEGA